MKLDLESLNDALDTLKDHLTTGTDATEALADTADEYEIQPVLLDRKFSERHGVSPNDYVPPIDWRVPARRKARKAALSWAWQQVRYGDHASAIASLDDPNQLIAHLLTKERADWMRNAPTQKRIGAIFSFQGEELAYAGLNFERWPEPTYHLKAQQVTTLVDVVTEISMLNTFSWLGGTHEPTFLSEIEAMDWLEENTIVKADEPIN